MYLFSSKNYRFCEIDLFNKKRQEKNENEDSELPDNWREQKHVVNICRRPPMVKDTSVDDDEVRFVHCDVGKFRVIIWYDAHRSWKFIIGNVLGCYGPAGDKIGPHLYYLEAAPCSCWIVKVWNHHFKIAWQSIRCSKNLIKPSRLLIMFYFDSISFLQWGSMVLTPCRS